MPAVLSPGTWLLLRSSVNRFAYRVRLQGLHPSCPFSCLSPHNQENPGTLFPEPSSCLILEILRGYTLWGQIWLITIARVDTCILRTFKLIFKIPGNSLLWGGVWSACKWWHALSVTFYTGTFCKGCFLASQMYVHPTKDFGWLNRQILFVPSFMGLRHSLHTGPQGMALPSLWGLLSLIHSAPPALVCPCNPDLLCRPVLPVCCRFEHLSESYFYPLPPWEQNHVALPADVYGRRKAKSTGEYLPG